MNTFKSVLLPFVRGIDSGLRKPLEAFMNDDSFKKTIEELAEFGKTLGKGIGKAAELIMQFPKTSLALVAALGAAKWFSHGVTMGFGFNSVASAGGGGVSSITDALTGGGKKGGKGGSGRKWGNGKFAKMGKFGKVATGAAGLGGGMAGSYLSEKSGFEDSGTGDIASIVGGLVGGALGSLLGPVGTVIGAGLGSAAGKWAGDAYASDKPSGSVAQDFVMRPGAGAVPFSSSDTLVGAKPGGPIDKLLDKGGGGGASSGIVSVKFDKPLVIKGEITLNSSNSTEKIKLDDPILMREIASMVQQELRKAIGGGKLNPNPV